MSARRGSVLNLIDETLHDTSLDPVEKLLTIGLLNHYSNGPERCFPSIETLATYAGVSYGTARRRLSDLEQRGRIIRTRRHGEGGHLSTFQYEVVFDHPEEPDALARNLASRDGEGLARKSGSLARKSGSPSAHPDPRAELPSKELPSKELPVTPRATSPDARHERFAAAAKIIGARAAQRPGTENPGGRARAVTAAVMADRHQEAYAMIAAEPSITPEMLAERLEPSGPVLDQRRYVGPPPVAEVLPKVPVDPVGNVAAVLALRAELGWTRSEGTALQYGSPDPRSPDD